MSSESAYVSARVPTRALISNLIWSVPRTVTGNSEGGHSFHITGSLDLPDQPLFSACNGSRNAAGRFVQFCLPWQMLVNITSTWNLTLTCDELYMGRCSTLSWRHSCTCMHMHASL
jgi:hypothetical protein